MNRMCSKRFTSRNLREFRHVTSFCLRLSVVWVLFAATSMSAGVSDANRTSIMVVGAYVGADLVAAWHRRNLKMFAKLSRLSGPGERILVLYGQGHAYLLRDFIR